MRALIDALTFGLGAIGLLVVADGLVPTATPLTELDRVRGGSPRRSAPDRRDRLERLVAPSVVERRPADLAVLGLDPDSWRRDRVLLAAVVGVVPALGSVILSALSVWSFRPAVLAVLLISGAGLWWIGVAAVLAHRADQTRRIHRHGVSALLELASVAMAGGAGPGQALRTAASASADPTARLVRSALAAADVARVPPFEALQRLGRTLAVPELTETAAALTLADRKGAPIRRTLNHKADSVLQRLMRAEEAAAEARSVTMSLPSVLMLIGFLLFVMYPFLAALTATTG